MSWCDKGLRDINIHSAIFRYFQFTLDYNVSSVQTDGSCLFLYISRLQMVSMGGNLSISIRQYRRRTSQSYFHHHALQNSICIQIPQSTEGKDWFHYVDKSVSMELLEQLTDEFIAIYERSPARLKSKLSSIKELTSNSRSVNIRTIEKCPNH